MTVKKIMLLSVLTSFAISLFAIELLIPPFPFCPLAKIGISNIVTLYMLLHRNWFKSSEVLFVLFSRCILAALITGRISAVIFSFSGGICALLGMLIVRKIFNEKAVPVSVCGAVFHNTAQIAVSVLFYGVYSVFYTIPILFLTGILSGALTGAVVHLINMNKALNRYILKFCKKE